MKVPWKISKRTSCTSILILLGQLMNSSLNNLANNAESILQIPPKINLLVGSLLAISNNFILEIHNDRDKMNNDHILQSGIKRMKLSDYEYIETLLNNFGYQGDLAPSTAPQTERKSLPVSDERILIKLNNPKAKVHRDFSITTSDTTDTNTQKRSDDNTMDIQPPPVKPESQFGGLLTSTTQTQSQDLKKIVDLSFLQGEISVKKNSNIS